MKRRIFPAIFTLLLLSACSLIRSGDAPPTPDFASMTRVAAAVAATQTSQAAIATTTPSLTPTPDRTPLIDSLLNGGHMNRVRPVWPLEPRDTTIPSANPLCLRTCAQALWVSTDGAGTLQISLFEFSNRDLAVEQLREIRETQQVLNVKILGMPDLVELPTESWIQDNGGSGSRYTLHTRHGRVLIVLTFYLPGLPQTDNLALLTLYANEQINLLNNSGW